MRVVINDCTLFSTTELVVCVHSVSKTSYFSVLE